MLSTVAGLALLILSSTGHIAQWDIYEVSPAETDPVAQCLIANGYAGTDDGHERIYAPREWIEWCAYRADIEREVSV